MKFLFDLGGVFFDWNPVYFYKEIFKSKNELDFFLNNVCNDSWNIQQDAGRSIFDAEKELIKQFPSFEKEIKLFYPNNRLMIKRVYEESINILYELKKRNIPCFVLSNWSKETFKGMTEEYVFLKKFDGIIISGKVKKIKPQKEIYQIAIDRFKLTPNETVFIDDKLINIKAAIKLNFQTIHLEDPSKIKKNIYKFLK